MSLRNAEVLPDTSSRVERHTSDAVNARVQHGIDARVAWYARHPEGLESRLHALDREWDIERTLEANAATLALTGTLLGALVDRRFLILPGVVTAFLLQHALQGWCPPVPIFRRLGVRTTSEIGTERTALKALRGDFDRVAEQRAESPKAVLEAVRR